MTTEQHGMSAATCVAVYDEPDHQPLVSNDFVYAYRVQIPPGAGTLWHKHTEDTVYFSFGAATGQEKIDDGRVVITDIPCGASVSRPHREQPLVHQVTNVGKQAFHLIGAEHLAASQMTHENPIENKTFELTLTTNRFRTYRLNISAAETLAIPRMGLLMTVPLHNHEHSTVSWINAPSKQSFAQESTGFFAEWL